MPIKPNSNPIQTQFKPNQTQFPSRYFKNIDSTARRVYNYVVALPIIQQNQGMTGKGRVTTDIRGTSPCGNPKTYFVINEGNETCFGETVLH